MLMFMNCSQRFATLTKTYHFGCIAGNEFIINVPSICYIRWVCISSTQKSHVTAFGNAAAGQWILSNDGNRHFWSIFNLKQKAYVQIIANANVNLDGMWSVVDASENHFPKYHDQIQIFARRIARLSHLAKWHLPFAICYSLFDNRKNVSKMKLC